MTKSSICEKIPSIEIGEDYNEIPSYIIDVYKRNCIDFDYSEYDEYEKIGTIETDSFGCYQASMDEDFYSKYRVNSKNIDKTQDELQMVLDELLNGCDPEDELATKAIKKYVNKHRLCTVDINKFVKALADALDEECRRKSGECITYKVDDVEKYFQDENDYPKKRVYVRYNK